MGRKLLSASLSHDDILRGVSRARLLRDLRGRRVAGMFRRAKHAVMDLGEQRLVIQPGMTGALLVYDRRPGGADARSAQVARLAAELGRPEAERRP